MASKGTANVSVSTTSHSEASDLIGLLKTKAPRVAFAIATWRVLYPKVKTFRVQHQIKRLYTLKIDSNDEIYYPVMKWVLDLMPDKERKHLYAEFHVTRYDSYGDEVGSSDKTASKSLRLFYNGHKAQTVVIDGHKVNVVIDDDEKEKNGAQGAKISFKITELTFTTNSREAQDAVIKAISVIANSHDEKRKPKFMLFNRYGHWSKVSTLHERTLESVILPHGQIESLVADVQAFLDAEDEYKRRCIPWHRGHLYEGPPGTGKTSIARAIASHFGMDVWYLPLSDVEQDTDLLQAISGLSPRSLLLLEDVDVFHAATQRTEGNDKKGATLSGVLNALDGIATPPGLFTVLTTNTLGALDTALIRPGRIDRVERFDLATAEQAARLLSRWYDRQIPPNPAICGISPAQIAEVCKRNSSYTQAQDELVRLTQKER